MSSAATIVVKRAPLTRVIDEIILREHDKHTGKPRMNDTENTDNTRFDFGQL